MTSQRRRVGVVALAAAVLLVADGAAAAASPPRGPTAVGQAAMAPVRATAGIFWGEPGGGLPVGACAPANDGAEVTTLVFIPHPFPIGILVGWVCNGATGTWARR